MEFWAKGFAIGLYLGFQLPIPPYYFSPIFIGFYVVSIWLCKKNNPRIKLGVKGLVVGAILASIYTYVFYQNDFITKANQHYQITAEVLNNQFEPDCLTTESCKVVLLLNAFKVNHQQLKHGIWSQPKISVVWREPNTSLAKGDIVELVTKLNRPLGYENQFGFNYSQWAFSQQIYAKGVVKGNVHVLASDEKFSQYLTDELQQVANQMTNGRYLFPLILAESSTLSSTDRTLLQQFGLSHLFAISGLHIGVIFLFVQCVFWLSLFILGLAKDKRLASIMALITIWLYVFVIDMPIPATRAACLITIWLSLNFLRLNWSKIQTFSTMVVASLLLQPSGVLDMSWWLSMWAVMGIFVYLSLSTNSNFNDVNGYFSSTKQTVVKFFQFQLFISVWLLPVTVFWFSGLSLTGMWLNLLMVPLFSVMLIPLCVVAVFAMLLQVQSLSLLLFAGVDYLLNIMMLLERTLTGGINWIALPKSVVWFLAALIVLLLSRLLLQKSTKRLLAIICLTILVVRENINTVNPLTITVFDVGQGTSVLINRDHQGLIYDLGPVYPSGFSATKAAVYPNLLGLGITELQKVIISHNDSDHRGDIKALVPLLRPNDTYSCDFRRLDWQHTRITKFWPDTTTDDLSDNDQSCVLKVFDKTTKQSILLTGDIGRNIEQELVKRHQLGLINLRADILFSGHHGSRFSSSYPFLKMVDAAVLVHNTGVYNHFNFPTAEVVKRANDVGMTQYATGDLGQIQLVLAEGLKNIEVNWQRNWLSPFWKKQNPFSFHHEIR